VGERGKLSLIEQIEKSEQELAKKLAEYMPEEDAKKAAADMINKQGITKIARGECPRGATTPMACMLCLCGHMLECHYPLTCEEAQCSHSERDE
jgi:hypothetical protein